MDNDDDDDGDDDNDDEKDPTVGWLNVVTIKWIIASSSIASAPRRG